MTTDDMTTNCVEAPSTVLAMALRTPDGARRLSAVLSGVIVQAGGDPDSADELATAVRAGEWGAAAREVTALWSRLDRDCDRYAVALFVLDALGTAVVNL